MSFAEAVDCIKVKFQELEPDTVHEFFLGENFRHEQREANDVVWVNTGGEFSPHPGAGMVEGDDTSSSPMLMDDIAAFSCFIWGKAEGEAKNMMVGIIRAMSQSLGWRNFTIDNYIAITEDEENAGYGWDGFSYVLTGSIKLIMTRETSALVPITSTPITGDFDE